MKEAIIGRAKSFAVVLIGTIIGAILIWGISSIHLSMTEHLTYLEWIKLNYSDRELIIRGIWLAILIPLQTEFLYRMK